MLITPGSMSSTATSEIAIVGSGWRGGQSEQKRVCGQEMTLYLPGIGVMESDAAQRGKVQAVRTKTAATSIRRPRRRGSLRSTSLGIRMGWMEITMGRPVKVCHEET